MEEYKVHSITIVKNKHGAKTVKSKNISLTLRDYQIEDTHESQEKITSYNSIFKENLNIITPKKKRVSSQTYKSKPSFMNKDRDNNDNNEVSGNDFWDKSNQDITGDNNNITRTDIYNTKIKKRGKMHKVSWIDRIDETKSLISVEEISCNKNNVSFIPTKYKYSPIEREKPVKCLCSIQ